MSEKEILNKVLKALLEQAEQPSRSRPNFGTLVRRRSQARKKSSETSGAETASSPSGTPSGQATNPAAPLAGTPREKEKQRKNDRRANNIQFGSGVSDEDKKRYQQSGTVPGITAAKWFVNREPIGTDCKVDLENNIVWYFFGGGLLSWTLSPLLGPFARGATMSVAAMARAVLMPWRSLPGFGTYKAGYANLIKGTNPKHSGATRVTTALGKRTINFAKAITIRPGVEAVKGLTRSLAGTLQGAARSVNVFNPNNIPSGLSQAGSSTGGVVWNGVKFIKSIGYYALIIAVGYKLYSSTEQSKQAAGEANDNQDKWNEAIQSSIESVILSEMVFDFLLEQGIDLDRNCSFENLIFGTVWFSLIGSGLGAASTATVQRLSGTQIKTYNDFLKVARQEKTFQFDKLSKSLNTNFNTQVSKSPNLKNLSSEDQKTVFNFLKNNNTEGAINFTQTKLPNVSRDAIISEQNAIVKILNDQSGQFWNNYRNQAIALKENTRSQLKYAKSKATDTKNTIAAQIRTQRRALTNTGTSPVTNISNVQKSSESIDDSLRASSNSIFGNFSNDLNNISRSINQKISNGSMTPLEAVSIYERNYLPMLNQADNTLQSAISARLGQANFRPNAKVSAEISAEVLKNLKLLNQSDDFFDETIKALGGRGQFRNAPIAAESLTQAQLSKAKIVSILEDQILRSNRALTPKDLVKLRKELSIFNQKMADAANVKIGNASNVELIPGGLALVGATAAAIYYVNKLREEVDDLSTWRSCNLARALVWSDFRPWPSRFDYNQDALRKIWSDSVEYTQIVRTAYQKYIYETIPDELLKFLKPKNNETAIEGQNRLKLLTKKDPEWQKMVFSIADSYSKLENINLHFRDVWGLKQDSRSGKGEEPETVAKQAYFDKWIPLFIKIMILNSNFENRIITLIREDKEFGQKFAILAGLKQQKGQGPESPRSKTTEKELNRIISSKVWIFEEQDITNLQENFGKCFDEEKEKVFTKAKQEAKNTTADLSGLDINRSNILIIGDSTAKNLIDYTKGLQKGGEETAIFKEKRKGEGYPGWSNHHAWGALGTSGILRNLTSDTNLAVPKVAIIHMGYNDFAEKAMTKESARNRQVEKTIKNFEKTIKFLKSKGVQDIRIFGTKMGEQLAVDRPNNNKAFKSLDRALIALCESESGVTYQRNTFITNDGLHYGPKSSKTMLKSILKGPRGQINGLTNEDVDSLARMLYVETSMKQINSPRACLAVAFKRMQLRPHLTAKQIVGPKLPSYQWNNSGKYKKTFEAAQGPIYERAKKLVLSFDTEQKRNSLISEFKHATNFVHPNAMAVSPGSSNKRVDTKILNKIPGWSSSRGWKQRPEGFPMPPWIFKDLKKDKIPDYLFVPEGTVVLLTRNIGWTKFEKSKKLNKEGVVKIMDNKSLKQIVKEMLQENYGKGYTPYPYHSEIGMQDEENPDFIQDWKDFEMAVCRDESREMAIKVAKILVKDLELFGDVIDLVGKNQSVATEILKNFRDSK